MSMPTIIPQSTTSGPKIVLSSTENTTPPAQPVPHISQPPVEQPTPQPTAPEPATSAAVQAPAADVVEEPKTTPIAESSVTTDTKPENMFELVSKAEAEIIKKLAIQHAEESGLITKMKTLISETDKVEESEGVLQKKLTELQELRRNMETEPDKAVELLTSAGLHKDVEPSLPADIAKPEPEKAEPSAPVTPAAVAPVSPTQQPLAPVSPQQRVLNALQQTFSNTDATIAAMLPANATIERSSDKNGVVVSSEHGQIHFSNDDLKQAGITMLELSDIPYAAPQVQQPVVESTPAVPPAAAPTEPTPTVTQPMELTEAMKKLIAVLEKNPPASIAESIKNITGIYRSPDSNGILVMDGTATIHLSDAELIQADVSGEDISELPTGTPEMMPV